MDYTDIYEENAKKPQNEIVSHASEVAAKPVVKQSSPHLLSSVESVALRSTLRLRSARIVGEGICRIFQ